MPRPMARKTELL
uniref:Uncharacterized protein n=1 Tax=Arundo donax TaxID=35708 RepID=A0A0A9AWZ0_ARUDO